MEGKNADDPIWLNSDPEDTVETEGVAFANIKVKEEPRSPSPSCLNSYSFQRNISNDSSYANNFSFSQTTTVNYTLSESDSSTARDIEECLRPLILHRTSNEVEIVYEKYTVQYGKYVEEFYDDCSDDNSEKPKRKFKVLEFYPLKKIKKERIDDESAQSHRSPSPQTTLNTSTAVSVSSRTDNTSISSSEDIKEEQTSAANRVFPALPTVQGVINCGAVSTSAGVDNVPISSDHNVYFTSPAEVSSVVMSTSGRKDCMPIALAETRREEVQLDNIPFMENQTDAFNKQAGSVFSTQVNSVVVSPFAREDSMSVALNENRGDAVQLDNLPFIEDQTDVSNTRQASCVIASPFAREDCMSIAFNENNGEEIQLDKLSFIEDRTNEFNTQYDELLILNQFYGVEEATVEISACSELSLSSDPEVDGSGNEISVSDECSPDTISVITFTASQNTTNPFSIDKNHINGKNIDDEGNPSISAFPGLANQSASESTMSEISVATLTSKKNQNIENSLSKQITGCPFDGSIRDQLSEDSNHANGKKTFSIRPTTKKRKAVKSGEKLEEKINALREELKSRGKVSSGHVKSNLLLPTVNYHSPSQVSNNEDASASTCWRTDVNATDFNEYTTDVCSNNNLSDYVSASKQIKTSLPKKTWLAQYFTSCNESGMESGANAALDNVPNSRSSKKRKSPTYKDMIREVFLRSKEKKLLAREVASCVGAYFPECTTRVSWKKSVAGALSANICFKRIPPSTRQTRAGHWTYVAELDVSRALMKPKKKKVFRREYVTVRIYDNDQGEHERTKNMTCTHKLRSETFACRNNKRAGINTLSYNAQGGEVRMSVPLNNSTNLDNVSMPETRNLEKDFHSSSESLNSSTEGLGQSTSPIETHNNLGNNEEFFPLQQSIPEHLLSAPSSNPSSVSSSLPTSTCLNDIPLNMLQGFLETVPPFSHDLNPQDISRNIEREMNSSHFTKNMSSNRNSLMGDSINETLMHARDMCINIPGQIPNRVRTTYVPDETVMHAGNMCINIPGQIPNPVRTTYVPGSTLPSFNSSFKTRSYFNSVPGNNLIHHNHLLNPHYQNAVQPYYSPYNMNMPGVPAIYNSYFPYDNNQTADAFLMRNQEHYNYYTSASPYTYGNLTAEGSHYHPYNVRLPMLTQSNDINFESTAEGNHCHPYNMRLPMLSQSSDTNFESTAEGNQCHPYNMRLPMLTQSSDTNFEMFTHSPPSFNLRAPYFRVPRSYSQVSGLWYDRPKERKKSLSRKQPFLEEN